MFINEIQIKIRLFFFGPKKKQKERKYGKNLKNNSPRAKKNI